MEWVWRNLDKCVSEYNPSGFNKLQVILDFMPCREHIAYFYVDDLEISKVIFPESTLKEDAKTWVELNAKMIFNTFISSEINKLEAYSKLI